MIYNKPKIVFIYEITTHFKNSNSRLNIYLLEKETIFKSDGIRF